MPSVRCKPPLERVIQADILRYLKSRGYFVWRQNQGGIPTGKGGFRKFNGMKGLPDLCGLLGPAGPGGFYTQALFIEVKRPGEKLRPEQASFLKTAHQLGHLAFMATCLDDVKARGL